MDRKEKFKQLQEQGLTVQEIGKMYNISHQRVCQILRSQVKKFNKIKVEKTKTYVDYLKESDYSDKLKSIYIQEYNQYAISQTTESTE